MPQATSRRIVITAYDGTYPVRVANERSVNSRASRRWIRPRGGRKPASTSTFGCWGHKASIGTF